MTRYRKKPETAKAVQWIGDMGAIREFFEYDNDSALRIEHPNMDLILPPRQSGERDVSVPLGFWLVEDDADPFRIGNYTLHGPKHFRELYDEEDPQ